MSKLMRRNLTAQKEETLPKTVEKIVPVRALSPNILIGQGGVVRHETPFNSMGIYMGDVSTSLEEKGGWTKLYNNMCGAAYDKLQFLLTDVFMSALNTCINSGLIDYDKVDLHEFSYIPVNARICSLTDIGALSHMLCCKMYASLYKYAIFGRHSSPEEATEIVEYLNRIVANCSNIIIHHLVGYHNEMTALRAMSYHNEDLVEEIGQYDEAYKTENLLGEIFLEPEEVERTNKVIEFDVDTKRNYDNLGVEFKFNPEVRKNLDRTYHRDNDDNYEF